MKVKNLLLDHRLQMLLIVVILSLGVIFIKGISFGMEFEGGVRIPITFDKDLTPTQMNEVADIIKTRISKFGLSQVVVRPIPPREIQVELSKGDESSIKQIEELIQQQGMFEAVIDGQVALTSEDILPGSIGDGRVERTASNTYRWSVDFAVTEEGANKFAAVAYGKGGEPVYMFLDKPEHAVVLMEPRHLEVYSDPTTVFESLLDLARVGNSSLRIFLIDDWNSKSSQVYSYLESAPNDTVVIMSSNSTFKLNYPNVKLVDDNDLVPQVYPTSTGRVIVSEWKAIGLLSAPTLAEGLAQGKPSRLVSVSGSAETLDDAQLSAKKIKSVLSGGRLPVNAVVGSSVSIPAPLGQQFLRMSLIGAVIAFILVVMFVTMRYKSPNLVIPVILISLSELIILVAVIGGFGTIDFAAMAGIIASMGVSLDSQIIITDEILRGGASKEEVKERIKSAFYIITRNVITSVVAMLPLFFSGIVEVVGFATSTILGAILGLLISRPAYAALVEHFEFDE